MALTIKVNIRNEEQKYTQRFLCYPEDMSIGLSREDATLDRMVKDAISNFKGDPEEIVIKAEFIW